MTQLYTNVLYDIDNNINFQSPGTNALHFLDMRFHSLPMDSYLSIVFNDTNLK